MSLTISAYVRTNLRKCRKKIRTNNISARKKSRREVGGPAQRLQAGVRQRERVTRARAHPTPTLDFFRAISAGECVFVSTHCGPVWRQAQLTDAIGLSGSVLGYIGTTPPIGYVR
jgi:hypothetical protein